MDTGASKPGLPASDKHRFYEGLRPKAKDTKLIIQFFLGIGICALLFLKVLKILVGAKVVLLIEANTGLNAGFLLDKHPLELVGYGLALSAGFELAYMLFTPGLDEAVGPLILGLSATILIILEKPNIAIWEKSLAVFVFVPAIGLLFYIGRIFNLFNEE
jgi:hypothetical protein